MPKVSVIIPAHNAAGFLERSVRSALTQSEPDLEVIVVDDGSTDNTIEVASHLAEEDRRVRVLRNEGNGGVSLARNRALSVATGEWIALLDADDAWLPERLEALLAASDGADVVCDDLLLVEASGGDRSAGEYWSLFGWVGLRRRHPHWLTLPVLINYDLGLLKPIMRRAFLNTHSLRYDTALRVTEDYYLYVRLLAAGARWRQVPEGYYLYSRNPHSLTRSPDAVIRQHVRSSLALLTDPVLRTDPGVLAAMKRHHRHSRASLAKYTVTESARRREFFAIGRLVRDNPDYPTLLLSKAVRSMYRRVRRRMHAARGPVRRPNTAVDRD